MDKGDIFMPLCKMWHWVKIAYCITGTLTEFANRAALVEKIESLGGKVTGSVTKKTNYLINNDTLSKSSKNVKAMQLGIPIISEKEFLNKFVKKC